MPTGRSVGAGEAVGELDGSWLALGEFDTVGVLLGALEGEADGAAEGEAEGGSEGLFDGVAEGVSALTAQHTLYLKYQFYIKL